MSTTAACCPPGSWPQLLLTREQLDKDDTPAPKGTIVTVPTDKEGRGDATLYVVQPTAGTESKGAILVLPDIYSVRVLTNDSRLGDRYGAICDMLADAGYTVALVSVFRDKAFDVAVSGPSDGDTQKFDCFGVDGGVAWFASNNYDTVGPDVRAGAKYLNERTGDKPLGVVGFCFGTWLLSKASSTGDVKFAAAVGCHPATVLEKAVFGADEIAMLNSIACPTRFLWAGNDSDIYVKDGAGKTALEKTGGGVVEFPDMLHGWVSRGDMADETVKRDVEKAIESMMNFFAEKMTA